MRPYCAARARPAVPRRPLDGGDVRIESKVDPALSHLAGEGAADVVVEAAQEQRPPVELGHLDPEAREDARELDRDVAAPDDDEPFGQPVEVEHVVRADGVLDSGDVGEGGLAAGRDEDVARGDRAARDVDGSAGRRWSPGRRRGAPPRLR